MTHIEAVRKHTDMAEVLADREALPNRPTNDADVQAWIFYANDRQWFAEARAYVWAREDAGEAKVDESWGFTFAATWLDAQRNYRDGKRFMMPNLRNAYEAFRDGKPF